MTATVRTSGLPADFKVQPWVQAAADEVQSQFGLTSFGTYQGHEPSPDLACDIFVDKAHGDALAPWLVANIDRLGVDYVIWWQRIYNPEIAPRWRDMPDRGSTTANHKDHVHVSFNPNPPTTQQEDDMSISPEDVSYLKTALGEVHDAVPSIQQALAEISGKLDQLAQQVAAGSSGTGSTAPQVADELARRLTS